MLLCLHRESNPCCAVCVSPQWWWVHALVSCWKEEAVWTRYFIGMGCGLSSWLGDLLFRLQLLKKQRKIYKVLPASVFSSNQVSATAWGVAWDSLKALFTEELSLIKPRESEPLSSLSLSYTEKKESTSWLTFQVPETVVGITLSQ